MLALLLGRNYASLLKLCQKLCVSIQISINLGKKFLRISCIRKFAMTLGRVFAYLPAFFSQILDLIYRTVLIFIYILFQWREKKLFVNYGPSSETQGQHIAGALPGKVETAGKTRQRIFSPTFLADFSLGAFNYSRPGLSGDGYISTRGPLSSRKERKAFFSGTCMFSLRWPKRKNF